VIILVLAVVAGLIYIFFSMTPRGNGDGNGLGGAENQGAREGANGQGGPAVPIDPAGPDGSGGSGNPAGTDGGDTGEGLQAPNGAGALWYYDPARAGRYEAFSAENPEIPMEDIVWMVGADLDKQPYTDVSEVSDPLSLTLLVNKYFYFPQSFAPPDLVNIGSSMLRKEVAGAMQAMIDDAAAAGHRLWVQSGYRSYSTQAGLYSQYSARDGAAVADTHSARAGHSEHQSGLTADLNTITDAFGTTPEGIWAAENCWYYGFIIRYTNENKSVTLYKSEPWHFRYIGREAASAMRELGCKQFEEYWVKYVKYSS
jgi:D-alanyl-D-alanine carboxypeptidase